MMITPLLLHRLAYQPIFYFLIYTQTTERSIKRREQRAEMSDGGWTTVTAKPKPKPKPSGGGGGGVQQPWQQKSSSSSSGGGSSYGSGRAVEKKCE